MKKILVFFAFVMLNITLTNAATPSETIKDSSGKTYHYYATTNYVIYKKSVVFLQPILFLSIVQVTFLFQI